MKTLFGGISVAVAAMVLAGCSTQQIACTEIGVAQGVSLNIPAPLATDVAKALVTVCQAEDCTAVEVELFPSTEAESQGCQGTDPDESCSASVLPDGGKTGFMPFTDLPESEVTVIVTLWDSAEAEILQETAPVTPERVYPNGPQCDNGGVQVDLTVTGQGIVAEATGN